VTEMNAKMIKTRREALSSMIDKAHAAFDRAFNRGQFKAADKHLSRARRLMDAYDEVAS
jgi:hypothetical protein